MTAWILILVIQTADAVHSQAVPFAEQDACTRAADFWQGRSTSSGNWVRYRAACHYLGREPKKD